MAVVTDEPLKVAVPQFSRNEVPKIVDLIVSTMLDRHREDDVDLFINDTYIPLNKPVKNLLFRTLVAIVSGLKGTKEVKSLRIFLRRKV
ncbi:hypothetical protein ES703_94973 [subsurface metagenome]